MSDAKTVGLACMFIVSVHKKGFWRGFQQPCGQVEGTQKDPRSERYDDGLCPRHLSEVRALMENTEVKP